MAGFAVAATAVVACGEPIDIGDDCGPAVTDECCPCPVPEACPNGPPPLPPQCFPDAGTDGGDGGMASLCAGGTCVSPAPDAWTHVAFVSSWPEEPPPCPDDAPILAFEGIPAPPAPSCGACACDAPEGTCKLPETWTISSAACADPGGGVNTNFDPPVDWDGTCNQDKAILGDLLCGGVPCVRSITVSPPVIEEEPCTPHLVGDPVPPPAHAWAGGPNTPIGHACVSGKPAPSCVGESGKVCAPGAEGFSTCIMRDGEHTCPEGWGGARHVLYGHVEDNRACSACTCGAPSGGFCKVKYRIFSSPMCTVEESAENVSTGMVAPCRDFMPGTALAGKTAELLEYTKGTCTPSGGEVEGELVLADAMTVCCYAPVS